MLKVTLPDFKVKKNGGSEPMKYVVHGATTVCSCGSSPSSLAVANRGYITGLNLTGLDVDTSFSGPFGICSITKVTCSLAVLPKWIEVDMHQKVNGGLHPLLKKSVLACFLGGVISITDNGQQMSSSSTELLKDDYRADE